MALDRLTEDLNYLARLGDDPKRDDGLSTSQFKSHFDKAGLVIQNFINNKLIPQIESFLDEGTVLGKITEALNKKFDKSGGTMEGSIDMNGQKLKGMNAPTANDEAATKGYVDESVKNKVDKGYVDESAKSKVDKDNVVNNFTTTEEGFVADARALKVLNDTKLSKALLWRNGATQSEFWATTIPLNLNNGDSVVITTNRGSFYCKVTDEYTLSYSRVYADYGRDIATRHVTVATTGITIDDCLKIYYSPTGGVQSKEVSNGFFVPHEIFLVKEGSI